MEEESTIGIDKVHESKFISTKMEGSSSVQVEIDTLHNEIKALNQSLEYKDKELKLSHETIGDLQMKIESLQLDVELAEMKIEELQDEIEDMSYISSTDQLGFESDDIERIIHENNILKEVVLKLRDAAVQSRQKYESQSRIESDEYVSEEEVEKGQDSVDVVTIKSNESSNIQTSDMELKAIISDLEQYRNVASELENHYREEIDNIREEMEEIMAERTEMEIEIEQLEAELDEKDDIIDLLREKIKQLGDENATLQGSREMDENRLKTVQQQVNELLQIYQDTIEKARKRKSLTIDLAWMNIEKEHNHLLADYLLGLIPSCIKEDSNAINSYLVLKKLIFKCSKTIQELEGESNLFAKPIQSKNHEHHLGSNGQEFMYLLKFFLHVCNFSFKRSLESITTEDQFLKKLPLFVQTLDQTDGHLDNFSRHLKGDDINIDNVANCVCPVISNAGSVAYLMHRETSLSWGTMSSLIIAIFNFIRFSKIQVEKILNTIRNNTDILQRGSSSESTESISRVVEMNDSKRRSTHHIISNLEGLLGHLKTVENSLHVLSQWNIRDEHLIENEIYSEFKETVMHSVLIYSSLSEKSNRIQRILLDIELEEDHLVNYEGLSERLTEILDVANLRPIQFQKNDHNSKSLDPLFGLMAFCTLDDARMEELYGNIQQNQPLTYLLQMENISRRLLKNFESHLFVVQDVPQSSPNGQSQAEIVDQIISERIQEIHRGYLHSENERKEMDKMKLELAERSCTIDSLNKKIHEGEMVRDALQKNMVLLEQRERELKVQREKIMIANDLEKEVGMLRSRIVEMEAKIITHQNLRKKHDKNDQQLARNSSGSVEQLMTELRSLRSLVKTLTNSDLQRKGKRQVHRLREINRIRSMQNDECFGLKDYELTTRFISEMRRLTSDVKAAGACVPLIDLSKGDASMQWSSTCRSFNALCEKIQSMQERLRDVVDESTGTHTTFKTRHPHTQLRKIVEQDSANRPFQPHLIGKLEFIAGKAEPSSHRKMYVEYEDHQHILQKLSLLVK